MLWATVNVCQTKGKQAAQGGSIGVRGQMPTLGFASTLSMTIQLNRYSAKSKSFVALPYATAKTTVSPGAFATDLHQDGAVFPFSGPAGLLNATVTFSWTRAGKLLGSTTQQTTAGHRDAAGGRPAHYSTGAVPARLRRVTVSVRRVDDRRCGAGAMTTGSGAPESERGKEQQGRERQPEHESGAEAVR